MHVSHVTPCQLYICVCPIYLVLCLPFLCHMMYMSMRVCYACMRVVCHPHVHVSPIPSRPIISWIIPVMSLSVLAWSWHAMRECCCVSCVSRVCVCMYVCVRVYCVVCVYVYMYVSEMACHDHRPAVTCVACARVAGQPLGTLSCERGCHPWICILCMYVCMT
jgi:hypothetical protein